MQIGKPDLDEMSGEAIVPALKACGLDPKRVDKHNEGGLLKSEIVAFLKEADIIVADLTNERPNCYLEIGYAMGLGKFENLILTCREDHVPGSPNYDPSGPRVHFDLAGYDILFWDPNDLAGFRNDLEKRARRRLRGVSRDPEEVDLWSNEWFAEQSKISFGRLREEGFPGGMEIRFTAVGGIDKVDQRRLLEAADRAQIHSFGWPIGIVSKGTEYAPKVKSDGIATEIRIQDMQFGMRPKNSYDYWSLRENGDFLQVKTIFEDEHGLERRGLFFDTRITRTAELLLFCHRLYSELGVSEDMEIGVQLGFVGLKGRVLSAADWSRDLSFPQMSSEDEVRTEIRERLDAIEQELTQLVKVLLRPVFILFEYQEFADKIYDDLVGEFRKSVG